MSVDAETIKPEPDADVLLYQSAIAPEPEMRQSVASMFWLILYKFKVLACHTRRHARLCC
jgi:hypothetical protein